MAYSIATQPAPGAHPLPVKVCIATLTRRRPVMLRTLLESLTRLKIPAHVKPVFLVVENDESKSSQFIIEKFKPRLSGLNHILESRIGIPFARNRAVDFMLKHNCDFLLFVDDDCVVTRNWLEEILKTQSLTGAGLVGGPMLANFPRAPSSLWEKIMTRGIDRRYRQKERSARKKTAAGRGDRVTIITSNWLAHRSLFEEHGLRFRAEFAMSGGSDAQFDADVRAAKIAKTWSTEATVIETVPPGRVSFAYQFRRGRDQSIVSFRRKLSSRPIKALGIMPFVFIPRAAASLGLAVLLPLTAGATAVALARNTGWTVGRIIALFGARSQLYSNVTGG